MTPSDLPCHRRTSAFVFDTDATSGSHGGARRLDIDTARTICNGCPARARCLAAELDAMRAGCISVGVFGGTTQAERRRMVNPDRVQGQAFVRRPITHGTTGGYVRCLKRPEKACAECKAAHARGRADKRSHGYRADHARAWTLRFIRRLRAAALVESWALRNEMEVA